MTNKPKVLAALVGLYERGIGRLEVRAEDLAHVTGIGVDEVQAIIHELWSEDYLAYDGTSYRLTELGYRKYIRETNAGRMD